MFISRRREDLTVRYTVSGPIIMSEVDICDILSLRNSKLLILFAMFFLFGEFLASYEIPP